MTMDQEIKKLVETYVREIESKEADLSLLKNGIGEIISRAQGELKAVLTNLDTQFEANGITEEKYLDVLRKEKENILQKTKERLDQFVGTMSA